MFYVDPQRTVTRRDSSLISSRQDRTESMSAVPSRTPPPPAAPPSSARLTERTESSTSMLMRPSGSIQRELVTSLFESMLGCIVDTWDVVAPSRNTSAHLSFLLSESGLSKKKRNPTARKKKSLSKVAIENHLDHLDPMEMVWWSAPDEKAIIRFKNGNVYEGNVSMKRMNGQGRFQWADGTVYIGEFIDNVITGKGTLYWKDDCWYEGEFYGNLRHGKGLYVDSRHQRSYCGTWDLGTKHGFGAIYYKADFTNYYEGEWQQNVRHGYGIREYCKHSGYKGDWDFYVREGKGLMIWPNHDFYAGDWKNGKMSGYGTYLWDVVNNDTMTLPTMIGFDGDWMKGVRDGWGTLELGLGLGSYYKGQFKNNKKHGRGQLVTNNGLILMDKQLFTDDLFGPLSGIRPLVDTTRIKPKNIMNKLSQTDDYHFNICDDSVGLHFHIQKALLNIDRETEIRARIIDDYLEKNKYTEQKFCLQNSLDKKDTNEIDLEDLIVFEKKMLSKAIRCYETQLRDIYTKYSNTCTTEKVHFTPVLIRLFMWQFYYDCDIHQQGLTLYDIDTMIHSNKEFLSVRCHNPFESIQFWQFLQGLIMVATRLFGQRHYPGPRPETILAAAFRTFMDELAVPASGRFKGHLEPEYGMIISLKGLYSVYKSIGEPHTVRDFLCSVRRAPHLIDWPQPDIIDTPEDCLPHGRNMYSFGDEMTFNINDVIARNVACPRDSENEELPLYNFGNLSNKTIIKIFNDVFPDIICVDDKVLNLNVKMVFLEFFEAFMMCAKESVIIQEEENILRDKCRVQEDARILAMSKKLLNSRKSQHI